MRSVIFIRSVLRSSFACILLFPAFAGIGGREDVSALEPSGGVESGKLVYDHRCARCHGPKGGGDGPQAGVLIVRPADFRSGKIASKSDEQLLATIEFGVVMSPMHAWRGQLTSDEMRDVLAYIRHLTQTTQ